MKKVYAYVYIKPLQNRAALLVFLSNIEIIPFEILTVKTYEKMRYDLKTKGEIIWINDLLVKLMPDLWVMS